MVHKANFRSLEGKASVHHNWAVPGWHQCNQIRERGWLTILELREIFRRIEYGSIQQEREGNREQWGSRENVTSIEVDTICSQIHEASSNLQTENNISSHVASSWDSGIRQTLCMVGGACLTDVETKLINRLNEILSEERWSLPSIWSVNKRTLNIEAERVNKLNESFYGGTVFVAEKLNMFKEKTKKSKSAWVGRLEQQVNNLYELKHFMSM